MGKGGEGVLPTRQPDEEDDPRVIDLELRRLELELESLQAKLDRGLSKLESLRYYEIQQRMLRMTSMTKTMIQLVPLIQEDEPEHPQPSLKTNTKSSAPKSASHFWLFLIGLMVFVALALAVQPYIHYLQEEHSTSGNK